MNRSHPQEISCYCTENAINAYFIFAQRCRADVAAHDLFDQQKILAVMTENLSFKLCRLNALIFNAHESSD